MMLNRRAVAVVSGLLVAMSAGGPRWREVDSNFPFRRRTAPISAWNRETECIALPPATDR
jgi:hypothetical protein